MFEFRITKYDPIHRDRRGAYTQDDWTSVSDIGRMFAGVMLTESEYQRVEDAYATVAEAFLREAGEQSLVVTGLENHGAVPLAFVNGSQLGLSEVGDVLRRVLREEFWCAFEGATSFVHVGHDYYMYVGVPGDCFEAAKLARHLGLFVERFRSPYIESMHAEPAAAPDHDGE